MREQPVRSTAILYVCNNGEKGFQDRYDGEDFFFPVGEVVEITPEAAKHIFGYGEGDKSRALRRQGIVSHSTEMEKGQKWLDQFAFEMVQPKPPSNLVKRHATPLEATKVEEISELEAETVEQTDGAIEQEPPHRRRGRPPKLKTADDVVNGL